MSDNEGGVFILAEILREMYDDLKLLRHEVEAYKSTDRSLREEIQRLREALQESPVKKEPIT